MKNFDLSKYVFITLLLVLVFALGMYSAAKENSLYRLAASTAEAVRSSIGLVWQEKSNTTKTYPVHFLQRARHEGSGVVINNVPPGRQDLILLSGFFDQGNELRLIRRSGEIVNRWSIRFSQHFPEPVHMIKPPATDWNIDTHGALALPDGSVVFNYEAAGLVKLDRCGRVVWKLDRMTHHSVERAENGGFWVPSRNYHSEGTVSVFPPFTTPFYEDTILKVSEDGRVLREISVPRVLYDNGLEALLTATGKFFSSDNEIVHLNKVGELFSGLADEFLMFSAGDLILSLRNYNMLLVIDPETEQVKWWQIGPWIRQHDPEFKAGGMITVFNNNTYAYFNEFRGQLGKTFDPPPTMISNIVAVDPATGTTNVLFEETGNHPMSSILRGKHDLTEDGNFFITDFEGGRVLEVDAQGRIIWAFINRYNENKVAEVTEARLYPGEYFTVTEWTCT